MQNADVIWRAGDVPVSARFDDPYFAQTDGLAETPALSINVAPPGCSGGALASTK